MPKTKTIKISCSGSRYEDWHKLKKFQGELKELTEIGLKKLQGSMKRHGFAAPIFVWKDRDYILDGHQRIAAIEGLVADGWQIEDKLPVVDITAPNKKAAKELVLAYNSQFGHITEEGLYSFTQDLDWDKLSEIIDIPNIDFDHFTDKYMRNTEGLTDEDEIPEVTKAITKPGDLWLMGEHRVLCGDATKKEDVDRLMDGQKADMIFTDPPYSSGGFQEAGKASGSIGTRSQKRIANDNLSTRGYKKLINSVLSINRVDTLFMFCDWRMWIENFDLCENNSFRVRNMIVWNKNRMGMGRPFRSQHELIIFGSSENVKYIKSAEANVLTIERCRNELHETQKPIDLFIKILDNMETDISKIVYDPFLGSGSTLIACKKTNRKCYGLEIDEHYVDVIVKRWEDYTGRKAILDV